MAETTQDLTTDCPKHNTPLHIDVVTETYPPEVNGVAHTVSMLVQGLRKNQHHVSVIRPQQAADLTNTHNTVEENDFLVNSFPIPFYPELRGGLPCKQKLITRWTAKRPDVIHIATEGPLGWSAVRAAKELGIPTSSDFRTNFHAYSAMYNIGFFKPLIIAYLRWIHNSTNKTMVPTEKLKQELQSMGLLNLEVMPRGVDTSHFSTHLRSESLRASWGAHPSDVVLLSVGRLAVEKNLELLLRSYEAAQAKVPNSKLVIVGDGPLRAALEKQCPKAIFVGTKRGIDLAQHYASADIFVFPSLTETFGNVTIEAMASSLAVVAYRHAAAGDLIHTGVNGITVEPGDEQAFIEAVVDTTMNRPLLNGLGLAGAETARHHSWEVIIRRTEKVLYELIHSQKKNDTRHDSFIIPT
jgi:glycosyltransferase involved in cell wall biosynthesis